MKVITLHNAQGEEVYPKVTSECLPDDLRKLLNDTYFKAENAIEVVARLEAEIDKLKGVLIALKELL